MKKLIKILALLLLSVCPGQTILAESFPNPLTLQQALSFADKPHPDLDLIHADGVLAAAEYEKASAQYGINIDADLVPRTSDPVGGIDGDEGYVNDSYAQIRLERRLYDFGRTSSLERAAQEKIKNNKILVLGVKQQRRLDIMRQFFNVMLSDLRFAVDNENMAQIFVRFDKARERHQLGLVSDIEVKELEHNYQQALIKRKASELKQTSSRGVMGLVLNRPGLYPEKLTRPELSHIINRPVPDFKKITDKVFKTNPALLSSQQELAQAKFRLQAARATRYPVLSAQASASKYEREIGSRNAGELSLVLNIPLYQGGADRAAIMKEQGIVNHAKANLEKTKLDLYLAISGLSQRLEQLKIEYQAAKVQLDFRDLELDRNQGLYEMEVQTTLGSSMTLVAEAQWQLAKTEFDLAIAWAEVDAITGDLTGTSIKGGE